MNRTRKQFQRPGEALHPCLTPCPIGSAISVSPNCSTYDDASCQVVSNWTSAVLMPRLCKRANNLRRFTLSKARLRSRQIYNPPNSLCLGIPAALECGVALCWRRRFLASAQCMHTLRIASMVDLPVIYAKIGNCTICSYASVMAK